MWFDLLVALLILGIGTLRWHACIYYFDEVTIRSRSGILLQRVTEIPLERIASTVEEHPFYLRPLRAGVSAHQYSGRRNAGCGYAADAVSA